MCVYIYIYIYTQYTYTDPIVCLVNVWICMFCARAFRAQTSKPCALLDAAPVQHLDWKKASWSMRIQLQGGSGKNDNDL